MKYISVKGKLTKRLKSIGNHTVSNYLADEIYTKINKNKLNDSKQ